MGVSALQKSPKRLPIVQNVWYGSVYVALFVMMRG